MQHQHDQSYRVVHCREQFPIKLYALLDLASAIDANTKGAAVASVAWLPHGRAFRIEDQREFMEVAVPMFFKQTKIRSFFRQLNLWGYRRISKGIDAGAWHNEFFLRGQPKEMDKMVRIKIKGNKKTKKENNLEDDPDFYSMPPLPRLVINKSTTAMNGGMGGGGMMMGNNSSNSCGVGPSRRVSLEMPTPPHLAYAFQFNCHQTLNPVEQQHDFSQLDQQMPETVFSKRCSSSPCFVNSPTKIVHPHVGVGYDEMFQHHRRQHQGQDGVIPSSTSTLPFDQNNMYDAMMMMMHSSCHRPSTSNNNTGMYQHQLSHRSKSSSFANNCEPSENEASNQFSSSLSSSQAGIVSVYAPYDEVPPPPPSEESAARGGGGEGNN